MRIKKRSSLDSGLTGDKVPDRHNEATSRGGSEVSEKPTTKADDYYSIASDNSILQSDVKSQEKNVDIQENILSDDQRASISDAGMRLTDNTELSSLMRDNADYKAEIERLTGFYEFLANADVESSGDYAFIVKTANDIAKSVIAQSFTDITPEEFADYKKALRGYRLIPNLEDVAELEQMFGTFGASYRQYGKKLNMRAKGTENAFYFDEVWEELCEAVPLLDRNAKSNFWG